MLVLVLSSIRVLTIILIVVLILIIIVLISVLIFVSIIGRSAQRLAPHGCTCVAQAARLSRESLVATDMVAERP